MSERKKGVVIPFPLKQTKRNGSVYDIFPKRIADNFMQYHQLGIEWRNNIREKTIYEGYPFQPPGEPIHEKLVWFTDEQKGFGVWIYNNSGQEIKVNEEIEFGWSPFVRKSTAPPNEPIHIRSVGIRNYLIWYVDEQGYGQYGIIKKNGEVWLPHPKPEGWE